MRHLKYLRYLVLHKWFVMLACFQRGLYWQGIIHDWSKFLPSEWFPYADFFYGPKYSDEERRQAAIMCVFLESKEMLRRRFEKAWLHHQHFNPHHWQYWILRNDDGSTVALEMPLKYAKEMLSDWEGAGRVITGKAGGTPDWYMKNMNRMLLHERTRHFVQTQLFPEDYLVNEKAA